MMPAELDLTHYLGKEWSSVNYDCWGLVRDVYARELNIILPAFMTDTSNHLKVTEAFAKEDNYILFECVENKQNFDIITLKQWKRVSHCGLYIRIKNNDYVLHNQRYSGVVCEPAARLRLHIHNFYRYHLLCDLQ